MAPATIRGVANENPSIVARTLMQEFTGTSDTATYLDSIDPYAYDTREIYITAPYEAYVTSTNTNNDVAVFLNETADEQQANIDQATSYFANGGAITTVQGANPLIPTVSSLVAMAQSGLYEAALDHEDQTISPTYSLRFLADTGVLDDEATQLHITTDQWGMMHEENGAIPPGAWWLAPLGFLDHTILANDGNGDRDGALILGILALILVLFPYVPYLNRLPEKFHIAEFIWR